MKRLIILLVSGILTIGTFAQKNVVSDLFSEYYNDASFTKVSVSSKMFDLFTNIESGDKDEEAIIEAISSLDGLKIIASDSVVNARALYDNAIKKIEKNGYEELMEVKDAEEDMKFLIHDNDGTIEELVMVVGGNKHFVVMSLYGKIDLKNISKLSKSMNIEGMEHLENLEKK